MKINKFIMRARARRIRAPVRVCMPHCRRMDARFFRRNSSHSQCVVLGMCFVELFLTP